jgi:Fe-S cluster assembly ATP-binding protein
MLKIKNLTAVALDQQVLSDINLEVNVDEVHAIIGPPKAGKTALMYALSGLPYIDITDGSIHYKKKKINNQSMHERSLNGILSVFQELIEVPNLTNWELLDAILKYRKDKRSIDEIKELYITICLTLGLSLDHGDNIADSDHMIADHAIKNELLMMSIIDPTLALIDNFDDKLEDADKILVAEYIADMAHAGGRATIIFSKNKAVLEAIKPTHVHVMVDGTLVLSGGKELLQRIEEDGYSELSTS